MKNSPKLITPCINTAGEMMQPVRLHYKILKSNDFERKINKIKCIEFIPDDNLYHWFYSDEVLQTNYKIEKKPANDRLWILGKIQIVDNTVSISVNSIERAELALKFFARHIDKNILIIETIDIYNKLLEINVANQEFYTLIEKFFINKSIIRDNRVVELANEIIQKNISQSEKQKLIDKMIAISISQPFYEYENFPVNPMEQSIQDIRHKLNTHQQLAFEHLQGNTSLTMYELIKKIIAKGQK